MKKNSVISLVIVCSFLAGIFGAVLTVKLFDTQEEIKSDLTGDQILSLQKDLEEIKSKEKNDDKSSKNTSYIGNLEDNIVDITQKASEGVVSIVAKKDLVVYKSDPWGFFRQPIGSVEQKVGGGTGFFVTKDGKIITNKHVVADREAEYTVITNSGEEFIAKVVAFDPLSDLAIIKINPEANTGTTLKINPLGFIESKDDIKIGQFAIAIGNKLGEFENSVSLGLVSGKDRILKDNNINLSNLIQTDADIHPGNSGGPLLDLNGRVIGINTAIINQSEAIGFAIQISKKKIEYMLKSIEKFGDIKRPFLGISYIPNSSSISKQHNLRTSDGIYIINEPSAIVKGSNADKIGLKPGDIITEIDEIKLDNKNTLNSMIQWKYPGEKIKLKVIKPSGEIKRLELTLGAL